MNAEQRKMIQVVLVILGCFSIYTYTVVFTNVVHYCDWTGEMIQDRIGHEVTFQFHNGSVRHYHSVNVSLLAFQYLIDTEQIEQLENIKVRCPMCGMLMDWDDPMIVWVYSESYLNPTTHEPTMAPLCGDVDGTDMCQSHFIDLYGGQICENPYVWP
jgi:hypothetical protein